jgi:hypothetical protein
MIRLNQADPAGAEKESLRTRPPQFFMPVV